MGGNIPRGRERFPCRGKHLTRAKKTPGKRPFQQKPKNGKKEKRKRDMRQHHSRLREEDIPWQEKPPITRKKVNF